jgi:hypothetical protein
LESEDEFRKFGVPDHELEFLIAWLSIIDHKLDVVENVSLAQWRSFIDISTGKNTKDEFRKFGEGLDEPFIHQRMFAIWEAQETMER